MVTALTFTLPHGPYDPNVDRENDSTDNDGGESSIRNVVEVGREELEGENDEDSGHNAAHGCSHSRSMVDHRPREAPCDRHRVTEGSDEIREPNGNHFLGRVDPRCSCDGLGNRNVLHDGEERDDEEGRGTLTHDLGQGELLLLTRVTIVPTELEVRDDEGWEPGYDFTWNYRIAYPLILCIYILSTLQGSKDNHTYLPTTATCGGSPQIA